MNVHKNARLTPCGRVLLVERIEQGWPVEQAAAASGVSVRSAYRWLGRYRAGDRQLNDRSSAPRRCPHQLALLEPRPPVIRYERERPGEMIHLDIKKLGKINGIGHRFAPRGPGMHANKGHGWDFLHVAIDDASRLAYTEILPSEGQADTTAFLERSMSWFSRLGIGIERVMTDNGSAYRSKLFAEALRQASARHIRTRPYTPRTNGKAERFIQSCLREWAYARPFLSSAQRRHAAADWTNAYNLVRPHTAIGGLTPWIRVNNLLGNDT